MRKTILLAMALIVGFMANAQKAIISGVVMDGQKLSLPGATVKLSPGNRYTVSDVYGKFEFLNIPNANSYTIEVSYIGYTTKEEKMTIREGEAKSLVIVLTEAGTLSEVIVRGDRLRGQAKALNQQRNNPNITNIVSADQVGRFPDDNIGDAMKRIPGITMQNDQGEARNIIVRGLASELNSVTLNGDRIPSAEGDNRKVQMDLIPSDMIQTIEVNKTLTSDMDADAIGGSVNLVTRAAPNGQRISATVSGGYNPIRSKGSYNASLVYGTRFAKNKLGIVFSGSHKTNDFGSDNVEATWVQDDFGNAYVEEHDVRKYDVKRTRRSAALAFDYKINAKHQLAMNAMYNWRDDWENRYRARTRGIKPVYDADNDIIGYTGSIRRQTKGGIDNNRVQNTRLEEQKIQKYSLRGDHLFGNTLDMDWSVNYSRASEYRPNERYIEYQSSTVSFGLDGTPERPMFTPTTAIPLTGYSFRTLSEQNSDTYEDELAAKLNFRIPVNVIAGQKGRLRFGANVRIRNKQRNNDFNEYEPLNNSLETLQGIPHVNYDGKNWQPTSKYVPGSFADRQYLGRLDFKNTNLFEEAVIAEEFLPLNYEAKERIVSGYVRWDQDITEKLSLIAGVRVEQTHIDYRANVIEENEDLTGSRSIKNNYANLFPSVTLKYNVQDNFILRAAATTATARPNYYSLSPYVNLLIEDQEIMAGNAALKAAYAWNYDLMGEYYFKSVGLVSAGAFYKKVNNFIYTHRDETFTSGKFDNLFPDLTNPVPAGENWLLIQDRNGEHVNAYGFEVAFQRQLDFLPGKFLKGFGIYTNYTYTKSKAKGIYTEDGEMREGLMLPGTAPHMFNASLSWENNAFSARLSLNYTAGYLDELGGSAFADRYYDKQLFLDANASYKFSKIFRVFAEANNLTNQPLRYYQGIKSRTMQMEYYLPRYNFGIKLDLLK